MLRYQPYSGSRHGGLVCVFFNAVDPLNRTIAASIPERRTWRRFGALAQAVERRYSRVKSGESPLPI